LKLDLLHFVYWLYLRELLLLILADGLRSDDATWPGSVPGGIHIPV
jgi:hypothetical protein